MVFWQLDAKVIYVKQGSNGNGSSWTNAFGSLQNALDEANFGDQIWVAKGKYLPTTTSNRNEAFNIQDGVELYGGFAGFEQDINQRNWADNLTILSGEIGSSAVNDNSYTVVYTQSVSESTVVDGFVITGGMANGTGAKGTLERCGGGWFNDGSNGASNPTIANCLFISNRGRDGAALYNFANNGSCRPMIVDCQFISNHADLDGGAIYNDGNFGVSSPRISNCLFESNRATYGAGMINQGDNGESKPVVTRCVFKGNVSLIRGGSIYNNRLENGISDAVIKSCRFEDNHATVGGDVSSTVNNASEEVKQKAEIIYRSGF